MRNIIKEIKSDALFIKNHELQPQWYKVLKTFLLLGLMIGFPFIFGGKKTLIFFVSFFSLSLLVHIVYRIKTKKFTQSWLDFIVEERAGIKTPTGIGIYYYSAVIINGILSFLICQLVVGL